LISQVPALTSIEGSKIFPQVLKRETLQRERERERKVSLRVPL
jgi:hypothetical protein